MKERREVLDYGMTFQDVYIDTPFHDPNWVLLRYKKNRKAFAWREFWRKAYPSIQPGYHQNKEHWNSIPLDGRIPDEIIKRMIGESYDLIGGGKKQ